MKPLKVIQHKHFLTNINCSDTMYESKYEMYTRETTGINGNPNTPDTVACWVLSFIMTGSMKRELNSLFNMLRLQSLRNSECRKMPGSMTRLSGKHLLTFKRHKGNQLKGFIPRSIMQQTHPVKNNPQRAMLYTYAQ